MARAPTTAAPAKLGVDEIRNALPRLRKRIAEVEALDPNTVTGNDPQAAIRPLSASIEDALVRTFGVGTSEYSRYRPAASFAWPVHIGQPTPLNEIRASLVKTRQRALDLLTQAVSSLEERLEELGVSANSAPEIAAAKFVRSANRQVFLVHGHDQGPLNSIARFLEQNGFKPVILHEQANQGRTIIEKFEAHAEVGFAVIIMTPDDLGHAKGGTAQPRARQNVVLELGYFIGKLGRQNVCAIRAGELELPSDILGVVWADFDAAGGWRIALGRELQAAGYKVNWNAVMGG